MTSMPASRRARAMTFAPRSWPSRPGFAMMTRSVLKWASSNDRRLLVFTPDVAERVAHLADRRIRADGVQDEGHQVRRPARRLAQRIERAPDLIAVARLPELAELRELFIGRRFVDVQNLDRRLVLLHEVVDADDDLLAALHRLLKPVCALRDLLLRITALDRLDHAAHPVDLVEVGQRAVLHVLRQLLDEVRAAQRIDDIRD